MVPPVSRSGKSLCAATPNFAVFFADDVAIGLELIKAADAAAAEVIALELHHDAQVHAVDGALVNAENQVRLLRYWLKGVLAGLLMASRGLDAALRGERVKPFGVPAENRVRSLGTFLGTWVTL